MYPKTNFTLDELSKMDDHLLNKIAIQYRDGVDTNPLGRTYLNPVGKSGMALTFINVLIQQGWELKTTTQLWNGEIANAATMIKYKDESKIGFIDVDSGYDRSMGKVLTIAFILAFQEELKLAAEDSTYVLFRAGL